MQLFLGSDMMDVCGRAAPDYETWCFSEYTHTYYRCVVSPRRTCEGYAGIYFDAVNKLGGSAFDNAQNECCQKEAH